MKRPPGAFRRTCLPVLALVFLLQGAAARAADKSFLWRVRGDRGQVYLLGSLHFARKDMYPLAQAIEDAYAASPVLVLEMDISALDPVRTQQALQAKALYPGGETMRDHVSDELYAQLSARAAKYGMSMREMRVLKPWYAAQMLAVAELQRLGLDPEHGLDKYFADKARNTKAILELESFEFQLNLLGDLPDKEQALLLQYTLLDLDVVQAEMEAIIKAWTTGAADALHALLTRSLVEHPELKPLYKKVFFDRNVTMAAKIEGYLRSGRTHFVVVGAGHLVGAGGIVELLKKKYPVDQQ
ncbi:MAG: TraB/GumN family protein [Kiritimatiellae bacterium]|nr:TraB/GumN family protein [Kiritimatiellia bacterium]